MDSKIILGKLLQRLSDNSYAQVKGYNKFVFVRETDVYVEVLRQKGTKAKIYYTRLIDAINFYRTNPSAYDNGPNALRQIPMVRVNSPVFAILHLLPAESFKCRNAKFYEANYFP